MIGSVIVKNRVASTFEALNQRNLSMFLKSWSDDSVFIYPGSVSASGRIEGRSAVEAWFNNYLNTFPKFFFTLDNICVERIFDMTGTNVASVHWHIDLTNRSGYSYQSSGVTTIKINYGKTVLVTDFVFDTGKNFKSVWGEG